MTSGISIHQVSFSYPQSKPLFSQLNLTIKPRSFLGITGTNGSGKSTLLYLLNGLIPHSISGRFQGQVVVDNLTTSNHSVSALAKKIGLVFQNPDFSLFNLTVKEELEFGLKNLQLDNRSQRINQALQLVNMAKFINRDPQTLSFGQKQKICLASVLALDTPYIVLDEPTATLDYKSSVDLYQILVSLHQAGKTIIVVEHDTDFLLKYTKSVLILDQGKIKAFGSTRTVLKKTKLLKSLGIKPAHL